MSTPHLTGNPGGRPGRRPDASMTLLNEVIERPLDPGYAAAAAARREGRAPRASIGSRVLNFALALVLGLAGVWAARELRVPSGGVPSASSVLAEELRQRRSEERRVGSGSRGRCA